MYLFYKPQFTAKFFSAIAPSGEAAFVSKTFQGRHERDTQITVTSGFLEKICEGDLILADMDCPHIETDVHRAGCISLMLPF